MPPSPPGSLASSPGSAGTVRTVYPPSTRFSPKGPYLAGSVLVGFHSGVSAAQRHAIEHAAGALGAKRLGPVIKPVGHGRVTGAEYLAPFELRVPDGQVFSAVDRLRRDPGVAYAEPNYLERASATPNDPSYPLQWGDENTGQLIRFQNGNEELGAEEKGTPGAEDHANAAWGVSTGSRSIVIGEVDTGVDYTHPDLKANIWSNPGGIGENEKKEHICAAGTHGYNVLNETCNPMDEDTSYGGHGTHVAGIMGAEGNNGVGVAGMNWQTTILPVRWLNNGGTLSPTSDLVKALLWLVGAKQEGVNVRVVNDSDVIEGNTGSTQLENAIETLGANNILFVTAAGNTGKNNDEVERYPCKYDKPTEICVAASNNKDELPSWASYGPKTVDLAAPGTSIYSTLREGKYGYLSGGSMASPQVAGAAALILSVKPTFTTTELKADILNNVDKLPSFEGKVITGGRLDVCKAMPGCTEALPVNKTPPTITGSPEQGVSLTEVHGTWTPVPASYAYQWLQCNSSGASCAPISGATAQTYAPAAGDVGHTIKVEETAKDAGGSSSPAASIATAVVTPTFGKGSVGASQEALAANKKRVSRYALSTPGAVSKLNVYLAPTATSGSQVVKGVIYADTGTAPGALIAASEQLTFKSTETAGWYSLVFSSPVKLAAGNYWIGAMTGTAANVAAFRYSTVTNARDFNENTYTSGASNPFGTPTVDNKQTSLYAIYTPPPVNSTAPSITGTAQQGQN